MSGLNSGKRQGSRGPKNLWSRLKSVALKRQGLIAITPRHMKYELIEIMRFLLLYHLPEVKTLYHLEPTDYKFRSHNTIERKNIPQINPNGFLYNEKYKSSLKDEPVHFGVFAPRVFATLRDALGMTHQVFLQSASPVSDETSKKEFPNYLEFLSNSKGNTEGFFFTPDRRFIFKMESSKSIKRFMGFLEDYMEHFISSPHSLLVKILGAYSIQIGKHKKWHFIVMQSIFWPTLGIRDRFDIKGCLKGRYQNPDNCKTKEVVLKDQNFHQQSINLGKDKAWFIEQLNRDIRFLCRLGIVDYSILVGIESNRNLGNSKEEKRISSGKNFARLVSSIKRSSLSFIRRPAVRQRKRSRSVPFANDFVQSHPHLTVEKMKNPPTMHFNSSESQIPDLPLELDVTSLLPTPSFQVHKPPNSEELNKVKSPSRVVTDLTLRLGNPVSDVTTAAWSSTFRNNRRKISPLLHHQISLSPTHYTEEEKQENGEANIWFSKNQSQSWVKLTNLRRSRGFENHLDSVDVTSPTENRRASNFDLDHDMAEMWPDFNGPENRRLLPDSCNGVHIIDGADNRYYFGIIDIFTEYGLKQKISRAMKTLLYFSTNHSSAPPEIYAERLAHFVEDHLA